MHALKSNLIFFHPHTIIYHNKNKLEFDVSITAAEIGWIFSWPQAPTAAERTADREREEDIRTKLSCQIDWINYRNSKTAQGS